MLEDEFMNFRMKNYTRCLAYGNIMLIPWFFGYVSQFYWILGSINVVLLEIRVKMIRSER